MAEKVSSLFAELKLVANEWSRGIRDAEKDAKAFEKSLKPLTTVFKDVGKAASVAGIALGGALAVAVKQAADYGDEINDAAKRTGVATEALSKLRLAAETSGSSFEGLNAGLKFLARSMAEATSGSKAQIDAFRAAGISSQDLVRANGDVEKIFTQLAESFKNAEDDAGKTAVAMALLGRSGAELIPTLNEGADGLKRWGDEAEKAGRVVTEEAAAAADEFNDNLRILEVSVLGLTSSIANELIPILTEWLKSGAGVVQQMKDWTAENEKAAEVLGATAAILTGTGGLLIGLSALPAILGKIRAAWAALTATISASTLGIAAAVAAIIYFRKEIQVGLMAALSIALRGMEVFIHFAAELADKIGLDGLAGKLHDAAFSAGTFGREMSESMVTLLEEMRLAGQTADAIEDVGDAHDKAADDTRKNTLALYDFSKAQEEANRKLRELLRQREVWDRALDLDDTLKEAREDFANWLDDMNELSMGFDLQPIIDEFKHLTVFDDEVALIPPIPVTINPEIDPAAMEKVGQDFIDSVVNNISTMFKDMVSHSGSFWESFKKLGQTAIAAVADTFIKEFLQNALKQWQKEFGQWQNAFQNWMKNNMRLIGLTLAGATVGGAIGGKSGAVAGAAAGIAVDQAMKGNWIAAAIAGVVSFGAAISGLFGRGRRLADEFVQNVQNPLQASVTELFNSLTAAHQMGTLTTAQVQQARDAMNTMWANFQAAAAQAGRVGQQALATMGPIFAGWFEWLDSLGNAARFSEINDELTSITDQLGDALIQKLDMLDSKIEQTQNEIDGWISELDDLNQTIAEEEALLNDATYWSKQYDDAIRESAENYQRLTDQRASIEKEIASLQDKIQRESLVKALERAKAQGGAVTKTILDIAKGISRNGRAFTELNQSIRTFGGNSAAIEEAQRALDEFDAAQRERQHQADIDRLAFLQQQLPIVIAQQREAEETYAQTSVAAQKEIESRKELLRIQIDSHKQERDALLDSIAQGKLRIDVLVQEKQATQDLMDILGIQRQTEEEQINSTINALIERGAALEAERNAIIDVTGWAHQATDAFLRMADALRNASGSGGGSIADGGLVDAGNPLVASLAAEARASLAASLAGYPQYAEGGYVAYTGPAIVHQGERVYTKNQNENMVELLEEILNALRQGHVISVDGQKLFQVFQRGVDRTSERLPSSGVRR